MDKKERFKKLAEYRTNEVLKRLKVLSNCANRSAYDYNEQDIKRIFNAIENRVREVKSRFRVPKVKEKDFRL